MGLKQRIGAQIKKARINSGMSQMELANALGYKHYQRVLLWETGKTFPTLQAFERLEKVLNITFSVSKEG